MILTKNSRAERVRLWREQHVRMLRLEPRLRKELLDEMRSAGHQAVMALVSGRSFERAMEHHAANLQQILAKHYRRTGEAFAQGYIRETVKHFPLRETKDAQNEFSENFRRWVSTWSFTKAQRIAGVTRDKVRHAVIEGEAEGENVEQIAKRIRTETGGLLGRARAVTIARTEVHAAAGYATEAIADSLNLGTRVNVWASTEGARTRPTHADADGQEREKGDLFMVGDALLRFPGDPNGPAEEVINCRCNLLHKYPDLAWMDAEDDEE